MMNLKSPHSLSGLSLIEVMATLALLSFVMLALSSLQAGLLRTAVKTKDRVDRIIAMKNFLEEAHYQRWKRGEIHERSVNDLHLKYEQNAPVAGSLLEKYKELVIEKVTVTWKGLLGEQKDYLINFVYLYPEVKKSDKQKVEEKKNNEARV